MIPRLLVHTFFWTSRGHIPTLFTWIRFFGKGKEATGRHVPVSSAHLFKHNTSELLTKKHLKFGQGLDFLKFGQGNRGPDQQNRRKTKEAIRTH